MASYQSGYDNQGREVDEHGNPVDVSATRVTYVATVPTGAYGADTDHQKQHNPSGVYSTGDIGRQHGTGGYVGDTNRQHGGYAGHTDTQHNPSSGYSQDAYESPGGYAAGPFYGTNTADTGTGPRSGTTGYGADYATDPTGYGNKEHRHPDQSHADHQKKGLMDKIKDKLPGGHSDNK
ncbi:hypothetical protein VNO78_32379 [Psophocarpus tetragonolobus]|uniref:Dehydrin n=1 Tax=Psophocarpus tetragonolobus TaxID=3891 RepID=A0AAN9P0U4_PSOTE